MIRLHYTRLKIILLIFISIHFNWKRFFLEKSLSNHWLHLLFERKTAYCNKVIHAILLIIIQVKGPHPSARRWEAVVVWPMYQDVHTQTHTARPHANTHRGTTVEMWRMWERFCCETQPRESHESPHRSELASVLIPPMTLIFHLAIREPLITIQLGAP